MRLLCYLIPIFVFLIYIYNFAVSNTIQIMKKILTLSLLGVVVLSSCGDNNSGSEETRLAKGNVYYGGVFRMNEVEDFRNLYPLNITEVTSHRITNQVYEGLVKLSQKDLTVVPSLAEKWDRNEDATVWTFYLRKGVKFQDDSCFADGKGREVTAKDFKYCFDKLCEASPDNQMFSITFKDRVTGANDYYESTKKNTPLPEGVKGVKVIDDYTLQISLDIPFAGFLNILSMPGCWLFPKEAYDEYVQDMRIRCVGTGPFQVKTVKEGDVLILERNPNYWNVDEFGNQLPYLNAIKFTFIKEKKQELIQFRKGDLDMVFRLPTEMIGDILSEKENAKEGNIPFELQVVPALSIFYYGFQHQSGIFSKKEVRQAFNYAIDRDKIVNYTLKGEGIQGIYGIVPPSTAFEAAGYNFKSLHGFNYDPDKAKTLLAQAGYPNGNGFPKLTLQINSGGGDRNVLTAQVIQSMLKENLNIDVEIDQMPFSQHLEKLETGKSLFWRTGWVADYPDPETFLTLLYSTHIPPNLSDRSYVNSVRYKNPKYDSLFALAMREVDNKKRFALYMQADQIAIDDAVIMPIFYDENYRLVQTNVRNFPANAMEYRDMTKVYFVPKDEKRQDQ